MTWPRLSCPPPPQTQRFATGSDLKVMGTTTLLFGILMSVVGLLILVLSGETFGTTVNCATGVAFLLFGLFIYRRGRRLSLTDSPTRSQEKPTDASVTV